MRPCLSSPSLQASAGDDAQALTPALWIPAGLQMSLIHHMPMKTCPAAAQGFDITPDLRRMCSSLTLQQIYKLTEHHHDDWITGSQTTDTLVLLQTLKRVVDSTVRLFR